MIRSALGCAVLFVALAVLVTTGATARPDQFLSDVGTAAAGAHPSLTHGAQVVEAVAQPGWLYLLGLLGAVAVFVRGRRRAALASLVAGAVASLTSPALKVLFDRERPAVDLGYTSAGGGSFPSGHALASATVVLLFVLVLVPDRWRRRAIVLGCLELAAVAVDRVWLGAHWPSDVLAGFLLAGVIASLASRFASEGHGDPAAATGGLRPEARG